jgi:flagellar hook-associated protein 1
MSGLFGTLSIALSSLNVSQDEMAITANNVANVNTAGYSRQVADVAAGAPITIGGHTFGTGVVLQKIESLRDPLLEIQLNLETQNQSKLTTELTQLQRAQTQFGSETAGIGADITNFFSSVQQLSPDPSSLPLRQGVLGAANTLATDFNNAAISLQVQRSSVDQTAVLSVSQVNSLTAQIATVNQQISKLQGANQDTGALVDHQTTLIRSLSQLVDVQVVPTDNGISVTTSNGTALVSGSLSFALSTKLGGGGVQHIMAGSQDITASLTSGSLAGLIQIRDTEIPSLQSKLDQLASGFANALNTANAQGYDLNGNKGGNIFVPPAVGGVGAAAALTVSMTDSALIAASSDGTPGSNGNLAVISAIANQVVANGQTPLSAYSSIVFQVGSDTANTSAEADSSLLILQQLQNQRGSISGVSLDEEAANLVKFQTAYQAASRVVSVIDSLLSDALNLGIGSAV